MGKNKIHFHFSAYSQRDASSVFLNYLHLSVFVQKMRKHWEKGINLPPYAISRTR